jgi:hypothetical protein
MNKSDDELPIFVDPNTQPKPPARTLEALVNEARERDERIERAGRERGERIDRVGRALYGWLWSGKLNTEEWEIGRANRTDRHPAVIDLPPSGKEAATIAQACFRYRASDEQTGTVIRWLNDSRFNGVRILDLSAPEFEVWFLREFPDVSTQRRKDTVRELWESGRRPGRGGNETWETFCNLVREQSGQQCDDRTIQRDVEELLRASQS